MMASLTLLLLAGLWTVGPLVQMRPARHWGLQPATAALTLCAAAAAVAALAVLPQDAFGITPASDRAYQDVYSILARNRQAAAEALTLLAIGGIVLVLQGLFRSRPALSLLTAGHWLFHVGTGLLLLQSLQVIAMPRRYVDYGGHFFWWNLAASAAATLCLLGLAALVLAPAAALLVRLVRR